MRRWTTQTRYTLRPNTVSTPVIKDLIRKRKMPEWNGMEDSRMEVGRAVTRLFLDQKL